MDCGPHWWTRISQVSFHLSLLVAIPYAWEASMQDAKNEVYISVCLSISFTRIWWYDCCSGPTTHSSLYSEPNLYRLSDHYAFAKPNDRRALDLMNAAAVQVMKELPDLCIAYGVSDEYRYVQLVSSAPITDSIPSVLSSILTVNFSSGAMGEYFLFPSIVCGVIRKNGHWQNFRRPGN